MYKKCLTKSNTIHDSDSQQVKNRSVSLNLIKSIYKNLQLTSYLMMKDFPVTWPAGKNIWCLCSLLLFNMLMKILATAIKLNLI